LSWIHISQVTSEVEKYVDQRRKGEIKSLRTGFPRLDAANIDGFEWGNTITIGGRPSVGKSAFSDCLIRGFFANNDPDFSLLDFNWEMSARALLLRNLSSDLQRSYKYICSADRNTVTDLEMSRVSHYLKTYATLPIFYSEKPRTPKDFADVVRKFRDTYPNKKIVVRVDHTILARISKEDGDRVTMLLNLLGYANEIKKESDIIFLFLTQMNREFATPDRQKSGKDEAYPRQGDVFGGDATAMYSESMILLNRPEMFKITYYGQKPDGIDVEDHDLFAHIVKSRNSEPNLMVRFRENFQNMSMSER